MPKTKSSELRELSLEQLQGKLSEAREEAFRLRFRSASESIDNPMRFRTLRRDTARILTVLRSRATNA